MCDGQIDGWKERKKEGGKGERGKKGRKEGGRFSQIQYPNI